MQWIKLLAMPSLLAKSLENPDGRVVSLANLEIRDSGHGARLADYDAIEEALICTSQRSPGDEFGTSTRAAWIRLQDATAGVMIGASGQKSTCFGRPPQAMISFLPRQDHRRGHPIVVVHASSHCRVG